MEHESPVERAMKQQELIWRLEDERDHLLGSIEFPPTLEQYEELKFYNQLIAGAKSTLPQPD